MNKQSLRLCQKIQDQNIGNFLEDLASDSPTPGGGAVAALVGAMAAGLVEMVANLTKGKKVKALGYQANRLRQELLRVANEDCQAFAGVLSAYRSKSKPKIKMALLKAIEVPDRTKRFAEEVEALANEMAEIGNKNAFSDTKSAIHLANASQKSAEENIKINKRSLASLGAL